MRARGARLLLLGLCGGAAGATGVGTEGPAARSNRSSAVASITPQPAPPTQAPDPRREQKTGFDAWRSAGVDTMLVVPRASTHLEYTDIAYVMPASRWDPASAAVMRDWAATAPAKVGASATTGRASNRPSRGKAARQTP